MAENKVRMGRGDDFQGHTIVGGRPVGNQDPGARIPRGMELLIKKAAVDETFCQTLLTERSKTAPALGLTLDPSETLMLDTIPAAQLQTIIRQTRIPVAHRSVFLGTSAAAMMALLTQMAFAPVAGRAEPIGSTQAYDEPYDPALTIASKGGARPDQPDRPIAPAPAPEPMPYPMPPGGARPDMPIPPAPPLKPEPQPAPVTPQSPSIDFKQFGKKPVSVNVADMLFLEGIEALKNDTSVSILVETPSGMNVSWPIATVTGGGTLHETLRDISREANSQGYSAEILYSETDITIRFQKLQVRPDDVRTRGSRPDYPGASTKGIRPDFPENLIPVQQVPAPEPIKNDDDPSQD
jgi:hypothetical protein